MPISTPTEKNEFVKALPLILFGFFIFMGIVAIVNTFKTKKNNDILGASSSYNGVTYDAPQLLSVLVAGVLCLIIGIAGIIIYYSLIWK